MDDKSKPQALHADRVHAGGGDGADTTDRIELARAPSTKWPFSSSEKERDDVSRDDEDDDDDEDDGESRREGRERGERYPELPPRPASPARSHNHLGLWALELAALVVAVLLLLASILIPLHFEGRPVPDLPFAINLSTLVAIFSTLMRAAIMLVVAEVLGQLKWSWFSGTEPRPLKHLESFYEAGRGSMIGSFQLLFVVSPAGNVLAATAALITLLSFAMGPMTQQAIFTRPCVQMAAPDSGLVASVPAAHWVPGRATLYRIGAGSYETGFDMKGTLINGLTNPSGNDTRITADCPSGNCTFAALPDGVTHSSMGLCSACVETTDFVKGPNNVTNYTMPNDLWLYPGASGATYLNTMTDANLSWAESAWDGDSDFGPAAGAAVANLTVLALTQSGCTVERKQSSIAADVYYDTWDCPTHNVTGYSGTSSYAAASCALYPCLRNYRADVSGGVLHEELVSTAPAPMNWVEAGIAPKAEGGFQADANYTALKTPCALDGRVYDLSNLDEVSRDVPGRRFSGISVDGTNYTAPQECLYKLSTEYALALSAFFSDTLFSGRCTYDASQTGQVDCGAAWWLAPLYADGQANASSISTAMDGLATAVSNHFRAEGGAAYDGLAADSVAGTVVETDYCTHFDARWLALPAVLVLATIALLLATVAHNRWAAPELPVWKSSILPVLVYGLGSRAAGGARGSTASGLGKNGVWAGASEEEREREMGERRPVMGLGQIGDRTGNVRALFDRRGPRPGFVPMGNEKARRAELEDGW